MTPNEFKAAREALSLSQAELARILRTEKRTVERYEATPGTSNARKIPPLVAAVVEWLRDGVPPH